MFLLKIYSLKHDIWKVSNASVSLALPSLKVSSGVFEAFLSGLD